MVRVFGFGQNHRTPKQFFQRLGHEVVIDAPAQVSLATAGALAPPGVVVGLLVENMF
jgi:hypothetical protein